MKQPWNELEGIYQKYLRTGNLVERLSLILSDLISKRYVGFLDPRAVHKNLIIYSSLPEIQEELEGSIRATRLSLQALPTEPSKDPHNEISNLIHGFVTDLVKHIEGVPDQDGLLQTIRPAQEKFRLEIRGTAPKFLPFERRFAAVKRIGKAKFLRDEDGEEDDDDDDEDKSDGLSRRQNRKADIICIDEVLQRAHQ